MKSNVLKFIAVAVVGVGLMRHPAYAAGPEQPAAGKDAGNESEAKIPDSAAGIWQAIDKEMDEMTKLVAAGTVEDLHHHAYAVRDLFAALPDHSASLPAEQLKMVRSDVGFVATLASRLDEAGDSKDKDAAGANLKKLENILKSARAYYPGNNPK